MKTTFVLLATLFSIITFAQTNKTLDSKGNKGLAGSIESRTSPKSKGTPVKPKTTNSTYQNNECFKGISYKVMNWGKVSGELSDNYWGIVFKNNYTQSVSFSYKLSVGGEQYAGGGYNVTYKIKPGGIYNNDGSKLTGMLFKSNSDEYTVSITDLCFGDEDCAKNGYAKCGSTSNSTKFSYSTTPYDSPLNSNNPNYGKSNNNKTNEVLEIPKTEIKQPKKVKKVIPQTFFTVDQNVEPKDMLENLIVILKNLGYTYEETTYQKLLPEIPYGVYFKEFILTFDTKLPDYDYTLRKMGKRWVTGLNFAPRDGDILRGKCDDCYELRKNIRIIEN